MRYSVGDHSNFGPRLISESLFRSVFMSFFTVLRFSCSRLFAFVVFAITVFTPIDLVLNPPVSIEIQLSEEQSSLVVLKPM